MQANAMNAHTTAAGAFDDHAHVAKSMQCGQRIFALKKAFHLGDAFSQSAQHDRAVRDRLVTGYAQGAVKGAARLYMKLNPAIVAGSSVTHGSFVTRFSVAMVVELLGGGVGRPRRQR